MVPHQCSTHTVDVLQLSAKLVVEQNIPTIWCSRESWTAVKGGIKDGKV
jgi:hypothetical protein